MSERLRIVDHKPTIVSNRDNLGHSPPPTAVLFVMGWLGGSPAIIAVLYRLLPRRCRMAVEEEADPAYEVSPVDLWGAAAVSGLLLFAFNILTTTWAAPALAYAVALWVFVMIWWIFGRVAPAQDSAPPPPP